MRITLPYKTSIALVSWGCWKMRSKAFDFGCVLSVISSVFVILTYLWSKERRRHPATLIASRSVCDLFLAIIWLHSSLQVDLNCENTSGKASAFFIEFFVIASESLLACVALDVLVHAGDPFTDYRANLWFYFLGVFALSLSLAIGLVHNADVNIGNSFLPVCWTKYVGGRVISDLNVPMSVFFYIPWTIIFLLSVAALASACVFLGTGAGGDARVSALKDTRRVILAHALYWGLILTFFAPLTNATENSEEIPHGFLSATVKFLSGARALENAMVWFPRLSSKPEGNKKPRKRGEIDLSPILNTEMQRDVLVAAVMGMTTLLRDETVAIMDHIEEERALAIEESEMTVKLGTWRQMQELSLMQQSPATPLLAADEPLHIKAITRSQRLEKLYLLSSVAPILLACAISGLAAVFDKNEPTYLCVIFLAGFLAILLVLFVSWEIATRQQEAITKARFKQVSSRQFRELRQIWNITADAIATSLLEAGKADARFVVSAGRSGAFMFFTPDNRYVIKTVKYHEERNLCDILLPKLIQYCKEHQKDSPFTSLARVFACFEMRCYGRRMCLVVMENVTGSFGAADTKYDLKGSWYSRSAERAKNGQLYVCEACGRPFVFGDPEQRNCLLKRTGHVPRRLLKDNDFRERVLGRAERIRLVRDQIKRDVEFLADCGIMDYSLLLCVRRRVTRLSTLSPEKEWFPSHRLLLATLIEGPSAFQFGIIDWFTRFDNSKRLERFIKMNLLCRREKDANGFLGVSAVDPTQYRDRFLVRVVDLAFPLLFNVVQLVDTRTNSVEVQLDNSASSALDVSGVDSFVRLCQFVSQSTGTAVDLSRDFLLCFKDSSEEETSEGSISDECRPFTISDPTFARFRDLAAKCELLTVMVIRKVINDHDE